MGSWILDIRDWFFVLLVIFIVTCFILLKSEGINPIDGIVGRVGVFVDQLSWIG